MPQITAYNLVRSISSLPRNINYNYINPKTQGLIHIDNVSLPAGPIQFRRWNPNKGESYSNAKIENISSKMLWRVANAINPGEPFNLDRVLGASYNTRSVLETLIALTPEFYYCYPGRIQDVDGHSTIEPGHKHMIWVPELPHARGVVVEKQVPHMAISEMPARSVMYDNLILSNDYAIGGDIDIEVLRRHTQIQIALYFIGLQLGYRTWIAQNDKGIIYQGKPLIEHPGIISSLKDESIISAFPDAEFSARFIDCIWFFESRYMPAVMEVEHSTGITSGLTRMKEFQDKIPAINTRYVIVASDDYRDKVIKEANRKQFVSLDTIVNVINIFALQVL